MKAFWEFVIITLLLLCATMLFAGSGTRTWLKTGSGGQSAVSRPHLNIDGSTHNLAIDGAGNMLEISE